MSEAEGEAAEEEERESSAGFKAAVPGLLMIAALLAGIIVGVAQLAPDDAPEKKDPSFIDAIFANVVIIAAARVLLLIAAVVGLIALVYIAASVIARLVGGEWLHRAGPFEANLKEAAANLEVADSFFEDWLEAVDEKDNLIELLEERDKAIRELLDDRELLLEELARRRET